MDYIYIAGAIILLLTIYYHYLTKNYGYWEKKGVPYITGTVPGLGNMYKLFFLRKNIFQVFQEFYEKMPGRSMVGLYFGREPALLVRDPELVKHVLQTDFVNFSSNGTIVDPKIDRLMSRNPFVLHGEPWKAARQQLGSAYTSGKLKFMYKTIETVRLSFVKFLNKKIEEGKGEVEIELKAMFSKFNAEAVSSAAFGVEADSFKDEDGTFVELGKSIFEPSLNKGMRQLAVLFVPFIAKVFKTGMIPPKMDTLFRKLVNDMMRYRADHNVERNDFLQLMINLKKSGASDYGVGGDFDNDTITSHSASFFLEGYETSSITMAFLAYLLAKHPEIQQRVRDEVSAAVEKHRGITYDALQEMTYMDQALNESMRLYAPAGTLFKVCTGETELTGFDNITCKVEPGTPVLISVSGLQMDPEYWPNPQKFDPDRFSTENSEGRHKFTHLPFGAGPRACIGIRMALLLVKAATATIISNYSLELSPKTQIPLKLNPYYFMASAIGGLWVKLKPL